MTELKAKALAAVLAGHIVRTMPQSRMWGVSLTQADGRYVLIEEDAGAIYFDEHACWVGYHTLGDDPRGVVEAEEWIEWDHTERWATGLATLIGGKAHQSGGNIWVVLFERADSRFVVIGVDGAEIYQSHDHYERYYEPGQPEAERVEWV